MIWLHAGGETHVVVRAGDAAIMLAVEELSVAVGPTRVEIVFDGKSRFTKVVVAARRVHSGRLDLKVKASARDQAG